MKRLAGCIDRGLAVAREALTQVGAYVQDLRAVDGILKPSDEATGEEREAQFVSLWQEWEASVDPIHQQFAKVMSSFEPGLFVGGEVADFPVKIPAASCGAFRNGHQTNSTARSEGFSGTGYTGE